MKLNPQPLVKRACAPLVLAFLLPLPTVEAATELYRYINEQGNVVIDYHVPPGLIANGYEVITDKGVVIRSVPRQLSEEERRDADSVEAIAQAAAKEQERLRAWDESLLLRYSSVADIEAARERALRELLIRVSILKGNNRSLKNQVETYQEQAADIQRRGQQVDERRLKAVEDLQSEIRSTEKAIADRQVEIEVVRASFESDIERFEQLLAVVELRKTLLAEKRR